MFGYKYTSTKEYKDLGPVAYRQWRADTNCEKIHGYSLSFKLYFSSDELDARSWIVDYGSMRSLRDFLEEHFDHKLLLAVDDPEYDQIKFLETIGVANITLVEKTGCESIADMIYTYINEQWLDTYGYGDRVWCTRVEVRETESNMAFREGNRDL